MKVLSLYEAGEVVGRTCPRCGRDVIMPDHGADLRHTLPPTRLDLQYGSSFGASCGACGIHYVAVPPGGPQAFRGTTAKAVTSVN
ncbi:MAG: hypothetical protein HY471_00975 [Candidatus Sungbacteria bacterium]|nr:hypothetical protein [Candidatus Sungbacteria bacterium]